MRESGFKCACQKWQHAAPRPIHKNKFTVVVQCSCTAAASACGRSGPGTAVSSLQPMLLEYLPACRRLGPLHLKDAKKKRRSCVFFFFFCLQGIDRGGSNREGTVQIKSPTHCCSVNFQSCPLQTRNLQDKILSWSSDWISKYTSRVISTLFQRIERILL